MTATFEQPAETVKALPEQKPDEFLARALNLSLGKAHDCLRALLDQCWVKMRKFHDSPRPRAYLYLLTPAGVAQKTAMPRRFLARQMAEYDRLREEIESLQREIGSGAGGGDPGDSPTRPQR